MSFPNLLLLPSTLGFSTGFWITFWEIVFGTIFSLALLWVVAQIWKKEENEEDEPDKKA